MDLDKIFANGRFLGLFRLLARNTLFTGNVVSYIKRHAYDVMVTNDPQKRPMKVRQDKYDLVVALLNGFVRAHKEKRIASGVIDRLLSSFVNNVVLEKQVVEENGKRLRPPFTVAISPGKKCNLKCIGCYAASDASCDANLDFGTFDRILTEKASLWKSHLTVITGGEPFMYKSHGRDILEAAARHPEQMFMVYTNGTLITEQVADQMARLGNVSPAISVEGFEAETDARRGKGVYARIMKVMEILRNAGVPFGVSGTATRKNWDVISSREFVDHFFLKQGVIYMWIFQYMPIGRAQSLDLMVTPQQRKVLLDRTWKYVRDDGYFIADFWNSGTAANGCMAGGRPGGYFHINWHGDITPCVFTPYTTDNIYKLYDRGENLSDVLNIPFFKYIRRWQDAYGYYAHMETPDNWLAPCIIRDHHKCFHSAVKLAGARPADDDAAAAMKDQAYIEGLSKYGKDWYRITNSAWCGNYLADTPKESHVMSAGD
jgi:MoaA/NifB/PqqE/SkfB family radical SAM enzyme